MHSFTLFNIICALLFLSPLSTAWPGGNLVPNNAKRTGEITDLLIIYILLRRKEPLIDLSSSYRNRNRHSRTDNRHRHQHRHQDGHQHRQNHRFLLLLLLLAPRRLRRSKLANPPNNPNPLLQNRRPSNPQMELYVSRQKPVGRQRHRLL